MATLEEIRAKLLDKEKSSFGSQNTVSNEIYPFWNIPEGSTATIRFLPDGNANNTFFWVERQIIRIPFEGTKGQSDAKTVVVQVPCVEMWDKPCPILSEVRAWFKDPELVAQGRKYWKKRSYIFQGFVVQNPLEEKELPENPIRRFVINKSIFETIKASLMDPEMEDLPIDYQAGRDFKLVKTKRGGYADYSTSSWSMRVRSLSAAELEAIDTFKLFDLKDYLPKEPSSKELDIIKEMFEASVNGEPYDPQRWGTSYRPSGFQQTDTTATSSSGSSKAKVVEDEPPFDVDETTPAVAPTNKSAALDKLRSKIQESGAAEPVAITPAAKSSEKPDHAQILEMIKSRRKS